MKKMLMRVPDGWLISVQNSVQTRTFVEYGKQFFLEEQGFKAVEVGDHWYIMFPTEEDAVKFKLEHL